MSFKFKASASEFKSALQKVMQDESKTQLMFELVEQWHQSGKTLSYKPKTH